MAAGRTHLSGDVVAGILLAALSLPLNIGYAEAAGLPATAGIYAAVVPLVVYAVLAGSRRLVIGPDATIAAFMAGMLGPLAASSGVAPEELAAGLAALIGLVLLVLWALKAGALVRFLSRAVLVGFIAGLGIEVLTSQVRKIMNVSVEADRWFGEVIELVKAIPDASGASVAVGVVTIVLLRVLPKLAPKLPAALVTLVAVTIWVAVWDPDGVALIGDIPSGLPDVAVPTFGLDVWLEMLPTAIALAALTVAESLLISQSAARRNGDEFEAPPELFPIGAANVSATFIGAMPSGASASRTAAMESAKSTSQIPALVAAGVILLVVLFFTDAVAELPSAALAAMVANAVIATIEVREFRRFARVRRSELYIALGCTVGVLALGPLGGIVLAVMASAIDVVRRAAAAPWASVTVDPAGPTVADQRALTIAPDGVVTLRPGGPLFFANADAVRSALDEASARPGARVVVMDLERCADVDPTAADTLIEQAEVLRQQGIEVAFAAPDPAVLVRLERYGVFDVTRREYVFASVVEAWIHFDDRPPEH